jgi:hypothetical protein
MEKAVICSRHHLGSPVAEASLTLCFIQSLQAETPTSCGSMSNLVVAKDRPGKSSIQVLPRPRRGPLKLCVFVDKQYSLKI